MNDNITPTNEQLKFAERLNRVETAISLKEPDRVPVCPNYSCYMQRSEGSSYRDIYYDYEAAGEAAVKFYAKHPECDVHNYSGSVSGKANELAGSTMIDWPGRPGSVVNMYSSHQVIERELMEPEEYREMLDDFTGFMLRKYIPRAYSNIKGTAGVAFRPGVVLSTSLLAPLYSPEFLETVQTLARIGEEDAKAGAVSGKYMGKLAEMGFPGKYCALTQAPFDILGDYFRGTMGTFEDLLEREDEIEEACWMFADQQIEALQYLKDLDMPGKRAVFPLHKAMDGFMSDRQFARLYWPPLKKIVLALIDIGVTPVIYTEGPYDTRLKYLTDVPKGKVIVHFEKVDMKEAKRILGDTACIMGNLSCSRLEFGKKEAVIDETKRLLDICAPGGGYLFDFDGSLENAKPENVEAMIETLDKYGKY